MAKYKLIIENENKDLYFDVIQNGSSKRFYSEDSVSNFINESKGSIKVVSYNERGFVKETKFVDGVEQVKQLNEAYLNKFNRLVEYTIKPATNSPIVMEDEVEEPETEVPVVNNDEFEDTEAISNLEQDELEDETESNEEEVEELAQVDDVDRIKEIQDMQTLELNKLTDTLNLIQTSIDSINNKIVDIEAMKNNIEIVNQKVEDLTPPSTAEQLAKNVENAGGMQIQDVWNSYIIKNKYQKAVSTDEENQTNNLEPYSEDVDNIKNYNEYEIKKSFNL